MPAAAEPPSANICRACTGFRARADASGTGDRASESACPSTAREATRHPHCSKGREYKPFGVDQTRQIWFRRPATAVPLSLETPPNRVSDNLMKRWKRATKHPNENPPPVGLTDVDAFVAKLNRARAAEKRREEDEERAAAEQLRAARAERDEQATRAAEAERQKAELERKLADREGKLARAEPEKAELERHLAPPAGARGGGGGGHVAEQSIAAAAAAAAAESASGGRSTRWRRR